MALIIEDGSIVANATSYATLAEIRAYALTRGVTLSAVDSTLEVMAIKAMDYIEARHQQFKGKIVLETQELQWPRRYVYINGYLIGTDTIPKQLKQAQAQLVMEISNGVELYPVLNTEQFVVSEKIDVIETTYSERYGTPGSPGLPNVDRLLDVLLNGGGVQFNTVRT